MAHRDHAAFTLKVTGGAMPGVVSSLRPVSVYAATEDVDAPGPLHRDELSLYTAPPEPKPCAEPEAAQLEESVAFLRAQAKPCTDWCLVTYNKVKPKVQRIVRFGGDTYAYLRSPPKDFYPRAGVIGFTGVLGLLLARGSRIKKLVYPAGMVTLSASLYYPGKAVAIAKSAGHSVHDLAARSYAAAENMTRPSSKADQASDSETKPR